MCFSMKHHHTCYRSISFLTSHNHPFTTSSSSQYNETVITISNSLKQGLNWDSLSQKFSTTHFTTSLVEQVLLTLKQPSDAKRALGFFHWSAQKNGTHHTIPNYAIAIHILTKAKLIKDANALLNSALTNKTLSGNKYLFVDSLVSSYKVVDSVSLVFDLLVQNYAKLRMIECGFDVCRYLSEKGFALSVITYNTLLHVAQKSFKDTAIVWDIYEHMVRNRMYPNEVTIQIMINTLCKEGKLQECVDRLDRICGKKNSPSMIVNASLVFRVLEEGRIDEGMEMMKRMLQKGMILDTISYSFVVFSRVKLGSLESALEVYEEMLNRGFQANSFVCTLFIQAYCEEGKVEDAIRLMQEMCDMGLKPYGETFDHLIVGCSKFGKVRDSTRFCNKMMQMGFLPSCSAFNEMVVKLCENNSANEANDMLTSLLDKGFKPDEVAYARLVEGYAKEGKIQEVLKLYYEMEYKSVSPSRLVYESLINSLCACGKLEEAEKYLKIMKDRSVIPSRFIYETLIDSYRSMGNKTRTLDLYSEMDGN